MGDFSSKDFGKTTSRLTVDVPERLIHKNVLESGTDAQFSRERKHPVQVVDLPSKVLSMTIGGLEPGQTTSRHRHSYETVIFIIEGSGTTYIEDRAVEWTAGDAIYVPVWAWHHHVNASPDRWCRYVACENAPMLQNLGVALREEHGETACAKQ
jgi:quercetin dioxygenase-like cupin family protein